MHCIGVLCEILELSERRLNTFAFLKRWVRKRDFRATPCRPGWHRTIAVLSSIVVQTAKRCLWFTVDRRNGGHLGEATNGPRTRIGVRSDLWSLA